MKKISATKCKAKFGELFWYLKTDVVGITKHNKLVAITMRPSLFKKLISRIKKAEAGLIRTNVQMCDIPANNVKN